MNLCPSFIPSSQFCYMWTKCKYDDCLSQQGLQEKSAGSIRRSSGHVLTSAVRYMQPVLHSVPSLHRVGAHRSAMEHSRGNRAKARQLAQERGWNNTTVDMSTINAKVRSRRARNRTDSCDPAVFTTLTWLHAPCVLCVSPCSCMTRSGHTSASPARMLP